MVVRENANNRKIISRPRLGVMGYYSYHEEVGAAEVWRGERFGGGKTQGERGVERHKREEIIFQFENLYLWTGERVMKGADIFSLTLSLIPR